MKFLITTLLLFSISIGYSQELQFSHITAKNGLSQAVVNCVYQDKAGFMWFGTQDGLNKYNGYNMTVFRNNPSDSFSISDNYINCIYEDENNKLWIGTNNGGLSYFDQASGRFYNYVNNPKDERTISSNTVKCILKDKKGNLWLGTGNGLELFIEQDGSFEFINLFEGNQVPVYDILIDNSDNIWIATYGYGLYKYNHSSKKYTDYDLSLNNTIDEDLLTKANNLRELYLDKRGHLYVGTNGGGLYVFDPALEKIIRSYVPGASEIKGNIISGIAEDEFGTLWITTMGKGLNSLNKSSGIFKSYKHNPNNSHSIGNDNVRSVYIDKQGNLWFGTNGGGVSVYFRSSIKFKHYLINYSESMSGNSNNVYSIIEDFKGNVWLGTLNGGLLKFDRTTQAFTSHNQYLNNGNTTVTALFQDKDSNIWVGLYGSGLSYFNPRTGKSKHFTKDGSKNYSDVTSPVKNGTILDIMEDRRGLIWIATYGGGVYCYDKKTDKFLSYRTTNGLSSDFIYTIGEDVDGNIWIGTQNAGICVLNSETRKIDKKFQTQKNGKGISSNAINCFYPDKKQNMWVATSQGLNCIDLKTGKIKTYYAGDGMANDYVYSVLPDESGNLWMSTNKGVVRFNPFAENIDGSAFRNYDRSDGLQEDEFVQGAFFKNNKTGEIIFGGIRGFNTFFPNKIKDNKYSPEVYITSYKRFGKEVLLDSSIVHKKFIELSYKDNFFSFEFVALDYVNPEKNKYMYKMEGLNENWSEPATSRYASYTNLEGGDYIFRVKGCNKDGVWNQEGVSIHIRVVPPFYKTKMFYAIVVLLSIGLVFAYTRWRTASIEREKKVLENKVAERTAELAQKNMDITSSIQYAKRIQEAILPTAQLIKQHLPLSFILYKPKDIVSGDFYWFSEKKGKKIFAAVDCTGHGVPGAFMSMIGHNLLNQIVVENGVIDPAEILNELNKGVQRALKQGSNEIQTSDGMDAAICVIDTNSGEVKYSGAFRPLLIISNGEIEKIPGNKFPIGGSYDGMEKIFTSHLRFVKPGDTLYMYSDGYADQFGGEKGKKFMIKNLDKLLLSIQGKSMEDQKKVMDSTIEEWKGSYDQVDDILVVGIML